MDNTLSRVYVRKIILGMKKPFCISDLLSRLKEKGIYDSALIIQVLNELYEEGLVDYDRKSGMVDEPDSSEWAFYVS